MPIYPPLPCSNKIEPGEVEVKPGDNLFEFTLPPKEPDARRQAAQPRG